MEKSISQSYLPFTKRSRNYSNNPENMPRGTSLELIRPNVPLLEEEIENLDLTRGYKQFLSKLSLSTYKLP